MFVDIWRPPGPLTLYSYLGGSDWYYWHSLVAKFKIQYLAMLIFITLGLSIAIDDHNVMTTIETSIQVKRTMIIEMYAYM